MDVVDVGRRMVNHVPDARADRRPGNERVRACVEADEAWRLAVRFGEPQPVLVIRDERIRPRLLPNRFSQARPFESKAMP